MIQCSGWQSWKNETWRYCSGWDTSWVGEFSKRLLLNILATLKWISSINPKNGWYGGPMVIWPVNEITQPNLIMVMEWKCHVQERLATNKVSSSFLPNFSPVIADQYLFIFVKLEEDNICLFYNFPPSLCFNKPSDSETRSCLHGQVCRYWF